MVDWSILIDHATNLVPGGRGYVYARTILLLRDKYSEQSYRNGVYNQNISW